MALRSCSLSQLPWRGGFHLAGDSLDQCRATCRQKQFKSVYSVRKMEGGAVISTHIFSGETVQEEAKETKNGTLRYSTSEWATEESVAPTCTQKPLPHKQNLKHFSTSTWMYTQFCRQEDLMVHCGAVRTTQWPLTPTANLKSRFHQSQHAAGTNMGAGRQTSSPLSPALRPLYPQFPQQVVVGDVTHWHTTQHSHCN